MIFRIVSAVVLLATLGTSAYFRHRARAAGGHIPRRAEGAGLAVARAIVAIPLFAGPLLWVLNPRWMSWASVELPVLLRWIGVVLGLATVAAAQWVFRALGPNVSETVLTKDEHQLVTVGPYRWVRHPLYVTATSLLFSIGLMAANGFILAWTLLAATLIRLVIVPREEKELVRRFGDGYLSYMERTGGMLPRLGRR
jgi:protein-S-isoprenylcysteine O-methyltransferase Ste14